MTEFDFDELIADAVDEYRSSVGHRIRPGGTTAALVTAAHRKRVHTAALTILALVLVVVPVAAYAAVDHHSGAPAVPQISASPSTVPPTPPRSRLAPISAADLFDATLNFPTASGRSDPCPHGIVTLRNGRYVGLPAVAGDGMTRAVTVDLDHDGSPDVVGLFGCHAGGRVEHEAIAFRRGPDGAIETMGIVETVSRAVPNISWTRDGSVELLVSDLQQRDIRAEAAQVSQWRTYSWNGTRFVQTAGSTSFTVSNPDLDSHLSNLTFGPAVNGKRSGTMTLTVRNNGTEPISDASVVSYFDAGKVSDPDCTSRPYPYDLPNVAGRCRIATIQPGATTTVTVHFSATDAALAPYRTHPSLTGDSLVQVMIGDQRLAEQPALGRVIMH